MFILHTESSCGWGGQELRILEESRALRGRGHRVEIACPPESRLFREAHRWDVPVLPLPIARRGIRALLEVRRTIVRLGPDVVNTHSSTDSWLVAFAIRFMRRRPGIVRTRHIGAAVGSDPMSRWLYSAVPDRVVTCGEAIRQGIVRRTGADPAKVVSIPTGHDPSRFAPGDPRAARVELGLDPDRPLVGIVSALRSGKGHDCLLEAFASLGDRGWDLVIVGDGPVRDRVRGQVDAIGLGDRIRMMGHRNDPENWFRALDIACQPSYVPEGVPQAVVQAMMSGRPLVTTPSGAISDAVRDGENAVVVPTRDVRSLAVALERLMDSPEERERLGAAARREAVERFSTESMAVRMERLFGEAIPRR